METATTCTRIGERFEPNRTFHGKHEGTDSTNTDRIGSPLEEEKDFR